jgi:hypothetical protein
MAMTQDELLARADLVVRIGKELRRLGMLKHVEHLTAYYRSLGRREPARDEWSHEMVTRWAQNLRLAPYDQLKVKVRASSCDCEAPRTLTNTVWPGASRHVCGSCKAEWIELD